MAPEQKRAGTPDNGCVGRLGRILLLSDKSQCWLYQQLQRMHMVGSPTPGAGVHAVWVGPAPNRLRTAAAAAAAAAAQARPMDGRMWQHSQGPVMLEKCGVCWTAQYFAVQPAGCWEGQVPP